MFEQARSAGVDPQECEDRDFQPMSGWTRSSLQMLAEKLDRKAVTFAEAKAFAERELGRKLSAKTGSMLIREMFAEAGSSATRAS
jgi:hypothetical protein